MVLGLVALPAFFLGGLLGLLAIIFGIVALGQIKKRGQRGRGMAITGIVLGSVWVLVWIAFFSFVAAFF